MLIIFICFLVFLFTIYVLSKEDFIFIRKRIELEEIFNIVFLSLPVVLLVSRLTYILFHPNFSFLNPFVFLGIYAFPGMSLEGAIFGAWVFFYIYLKRRKIPMDRFIDSISLSFLISFAIYFLLEGIAVSLKERAFGIEEILKSIIVILIFSYLSSIFLKKDLGGKLVYVVVALFCFLNFIKYGFFILIHKPIQLNDIFPTIVLFGASLVFIIFEYGNSLFRR